MTIKSVPGAASVFVFRSNLRYQNSLQASVEQTSKDRPIPIPRTGTAAPIGAPTLKRRPLPQEK